MVFPFDRSEPGVWVSAGAHVVLIGLALFAAASHVLPQAEEGVPVEVITENQFSELTKGQRDGDAPAKSPRPTAPPTSSARTIPARPRPTCRPRRRARPR